MFGSYKNSELIRVASLSDNHLTKEIVYRWKIYIAAFDLTKQFLNGGIGIDEFNQGIQELKGVIE